MELQAPGCSCCLTLLAHQVFAAFIGIIAGLGLTLLCLAIYQKALPALPISIALGVLFYFTTVLVTEQFVVPLTVHYTFY